MAGDQDAAYNALAYDLRRALPLEQVKWELATSRQRLLDAISSATERGLDASLYGGLRSVHEATHTRWIVPPIPHTANLARSDVDLDGIVTILDLSKVAAWFGQTVSRSPIDPRWEGSMDNDGSISIPDLSAIAANFGRASPETVRRRCESDSGRRSLRHHDPLMVRRHRPQVMVIRPWYDCRDSRSESMF
jgi:hypothetical protein